MKYFWQYQHEKKKERESSGSAGGLKFISRDTLETPPAPDYDPDPLQDYDGWTGTEPLGNYELDNIKYGGSLMGADF